MIVIFGRHAQRKPVTSGTSLWACYQWGEWVDFYFWIGCRGSADKATDMNADGKSDDFILLTTQANKAGTLVAEITEGRKSPKGSVIELSSMFRTLSR
jgi:hypothetical protein